MIEHIHSVYAETYLAWAAEDGGYCIDLRASNYLALSRSCGGGTSVPIPEPGDPLFDDVVAAWSMEGFDGAGGESGHDHFFATFGKFGAISGREHGKMLADVMRRAASENQVYIELMLVSNGVARDLGDAVWSQHHAGQTITRQHLATFHAELLAASGMPAALRNVVDDVVESEAEAHAELGCDSPSPEPACAVTTRYQVYISRSGSLPGVFAQMVAAYEAGIDDPRVVGLNLVGPEDNPTSLRNYDIQMDMLRFIHDTYRATGLSPVRLSLHAGELAPKYMPSGWDIGDIDHITRAVERARAERIGHGLDLRLESDPEAILEQLRDDRILVEICLASNAIILEVSGEDHPLGDYLDADVPVALGTDDQGVARSSLAGEYRRAVLDQGLDYFTLKRMARMSLEFAFLPGESLWFDLEVGDPVAPCVHPPDHVLGLDTPPTPCADYLVANERAGLQYELERRFRLFERAY
ncbi:MAG: adenosine deaminase [Deltaproteobacteria bacterium]|nr:adenosine deaminase [Deltaproteobacteria bacterium]